MLGSPTWNFVAKVDPIQKFVRGRILVFYPKLSSSLHLLSFASFFYSSDPCAQFLIILNDFCLLKIARYFRRILREKLMEGI